MKQNTKKVGLQRQSGAQRGGGAQRGAPEVS